MTGVQSRRPDGVLVLDVAIGALVLSAAGAAVVDPRLGPAAPARAELWFAACLVALAACGSLLSAYTLTGARRGLTVLSLAAGAALVALGSGRCAVALARDGAVPDASAVLWACGALAVAVAPVLPRRVVAGRSPEWASIGIPTLSALVCLPLVYRERTATPEGLLAVTGLALIIVRLTVTLLQNRRLATAMASAAVTDALTGLANRDHLHARLLRARARPQRIGVVVLDLDDFKAINDVHGHVFGDRALVAVADRLRRAIRRVPTRSVDCVARLGGDEFVLLLEALGDEGDVSVVAERALHAIRAPLVLDGRTVFLEASAGVTCADPGDVRGPAELLRDADTAMYEAKRSGRHRHEVFEPGMHAQLVARSELVRDLRTALARGQLRLVFQPQYDVTSGAMTGVEALMRWDHPAHGLVAPDRFIPLAESSGLIVDIDEWALRTACAQLAAWDAQGLPPLAMAVNVSTVTLEATDVVATVEHALAGAGVPAARLEVEITETAAVEQDDVAVGVLAQLRALGVQVAIDDFGVGHSALSRLQSFPVDRLKIDRAFVAPLTSTQARGSLVEAMIAMGQGLGLEVVAEGVETAEQLGCLRRLRCTTAQGYLFSKPVAPEAIARLAGVAFDVAPEPEPRTEREHFVDQLLAELERTTGLESTYLTAIDEDAGVQTILQARNAGAIDIPAGLEVPWSDTLCRRALEQDVPYTSDVPGRWPDSQAAADLGLRTYVSVPIRDRDGNLEGTLCGASSAEVGLGPEALDLMSHIADLIAERDPA